MLWKRVLIAVDPTDVSLKAVEYAGQMFGGRDDLEFALIGLHDKMPDYDINEETSPFYKEVISRLATMETEIERGRAFINLIKEQMCCLGIPADKIEVIYKSKTVKRVEKDLAEFIHTEGYGTILLGHLDSVAVNLHKELKGVAIITLG